MSTFRIGLYTDQFNQDELRSVLAPVLETFKAMTSDGDVMVGGQKLAVFDPPRPKLVEMIRDIVKPETTLDALLSQIKIARDSIDGMRAYATQGNGNPVMVAERGKNTPVTLLSGEQTGGAMVALALALDFRQNNEARAVARELHPENNRSIGLRLWRVFTGSGEPDMTVFYEAPEESIPSQALFMSSAPASGGASLAQGHEGSRLHHGFALFGDRATPMIDAYLPYVVQTIQHRESLTGVVDPGILLTTSLDAWSDDYFRNPFLVRAEGALDEVLRRPHQPPVARPAAIHARQG